jgi:hypothetical protein
MCAKDKVKSAALNIIIAFVLAVLIFGPAIYKYS